MPDYYKYDSKTYNATNFYCNLYKTQEVYFALYAFAKAYLKLKRVLE